MNPPSVPLMLNDARDRAERELARYPHATVVEVRVDAVKYTFRKDPHDLTLVKAEEIK